MSEIKFRAWDKKNREWNNDVVIWTNGNLCTLNIGGDMSLIPEECNERFEIYLFTGLHDKNGKEIYAGDLFDYGYGRIGQVVFEKRAWRGKIVLGLINGKLELTPDNEANFFINPSDYTVIGNIYENPELLKEEN